MFLRMGGEGRAYCHFRIHLNTALAACSFVYPVPPLIAATSKVIEI